MLKWFSLRRRPLTFAAAIACFLMFAYAIYTQDANGLEPCPLCIFQRIAVVALGFALLLAALVPSAWRIAGNLSAALVALVALSGAGIAIRHLYIQSLPAGQVPVCGATLDYMLDVFPLTDVLRKVLTGSGECAKVDWTFLGLAMPAWVLICVTVLGVVGVMANWRRKRL
jgi:protein dithiol:quinone oxidoreductase